MTAAARVDDREVLFSAFPGFQTRALAASADEVLIGGAKGASKTFTMIVRPLYKIANANYAGAFVRESFRELLRPLDEATKLYMRLPAAERPAWNGETKRFTWPSRAFLQFGYVRVKADLTWMMGGNWTEVYYDEVGNQPDESVVDTIVAEIRSPDKTMRRQFYGSANPGFAGTPWIKRRFIVPCGKMGERIAWSRYELPDGRVAMRSRQFIPGRVTDNPVFANDVEYMAALYSLPDRQRRCLLEGDWDAAFGMAFDELDARAHLVPEFECPSHWPYVAAFDWGFAHWAVFGWGRVSDDGRIYICDTIKMRRMQDWDIAATILERVPAAALRTVNAGHDLWDTSAGKGDMTPTRAKYFQDQGIGMVQASIKRAAGYANMMQYLAWRETPYLPKRQPMVQWMNTPGNRLAVEQDLAAMIVDPDDPTVILHVDADPDTGAGGNDTADMTRYLLASRPMKAPSHMHLMKLSSSDDSVLRLAAQKVYRPDLTENTTSAPGFMKGVYLGA